MSGPKAHHYVPRVYLRAWEDVSNKVWVYNKVDNLLFRHSTVETIMEETYFYALSIDKSLALSNDDLEEIFAPLKELNVSLEDKKLSKLAEFRDNFIDFDKWIITRSDGTNVRKPKIYNDITEKKIKRLEYGWDIIENNWGTTRRKIINLVNANATLLDKSTKEEIIMFIVAQEWRVPTAIDYFEDLIRELSPYFDKIETQEYSPYKEFAQAYFYKSIEKFQQGDQEKGVGKEREIISQNLQFIFAKAVGKKKFYTSDNPVFTIINNGFSNGKYNGIYMPITPEIIAIGVRGKEDFIRIVNLDDATVEMINNELIKATNEKYISSCEIAEKGEY